MVVKMERREMSGFSKTVSYLTHAYCKSTWLLIIFQELILLTFSTTNVDYNLESISIQIFQILLQLSIVAINKYEWDIQTSTVL